VNDSAKIMEWSYALGEAISTTPKKYVVMRYRAEPVSRSGGYSVYLTGQRRKKGSQVFCNLIDDGRWHRTAQKVSPMRVNQVSVEVHSGIKGASIEIESITLTSGKPALGFADYLTIYPEWDKSILKKDSFSTVDLFSSVNARSKERFGVFPFGSCWFEQEKVTVNDIPFRVVQSKTNLMATEVRKRGQISILIGAKAGVIHLLLAAHFVGKEEPSMGSGNLREVRQVERFVAEIQYADGLHDLVFPFNTDSHQYVIKEGIAVYAVVPTRSVKIEGIVLHDNMKQGAFCLAGVTLLKRDEVKEDTGKTKKPASEVRKELPPVPAVKREGKEIIFDSGRTRCVFDLSCGLGLKSLENMNKVNCLQEPSPVFVLKLDGQRISSLDFRCREKGSDGKNIRLVLEHDQMEAVIHLSFNNRAELALSLALTNKSDKRVSLVPIFPLIKGLLIGDDINKNFYCYPRRGCVISNVPMTHREPYSGFFPMQFMDVFASGRGGFFLMVCDLTDEYKWYCLSKQDTVNMSIEYMQMELKPGEKLTLPNSVIGGHSGDWHDALDAYKSWESSWYKPAAPRKEWFRRVFNFRQHFFHFPIPIKSGMFDSGTKEYHFRKVVKQDRKAFGGVDYLHLFDWGWSKECGRCGDYNHWEQLGGVEQFRRNLKLIQDMGIPVGLYLEGYLVSPKSNLGKTYGKKWQLLDVEGKPYSYFAPDYNICSAVEEWQEYLARTYARVCRETGADGFYIDQMGFADTRHFCYNPAHGHPIPYPPLRGQRDLVQRVRGALPPEVVVYTEEVPTDVNSQYQDGAFTYAISNWTRPDLRWISDDLSPVHLNLFRFAFPNFKTFEIIVCDRPLGSDCQSVKQIFFNGEGIWLEGTRNEWFTSNTRKLIAKMHKIMTAHADAFTSDNPTPLVPTLEDGIYANQFPAEGKVVWTLYNANYSTVRGELIAVKYVKGSRYFDLWNEAELNPRIKGEAAYIRLELSPKDVGCIMQIREKFLKD